jgi:hypothetical protein
MAEENNKFKQVYRSTYDRPFEVWFAPQDAKVEYPFTEVAPDPSIKAPIFIWKTQSWAENDQVSTAAKVNNLDTTVTGLQKENKAKEGQMDNLNESLNSIAKNQSKMLKMMAPLLANGGKPNA